ncbi:MAG: hypothetical protein EAZ15_03560 [Sphingobacteriales bacterium]|nr:MAG: hypothetical protein EAZ15_03560 [Sphingobacteriales bacterium]
MFDAYDDTSKNGLNFRSGTKVVLGVGLAAAGIVAAFTAPAWAPALAVAGLAYGVADYYGGVDATLNLIHRTYYKNMGITVKDQ